MSLRVAAAGVLLLFAASACVGPARTEDDFDRKARTTADEVRSAVQTALLVVEATDVHHLNPQYVSVVVGESEDDASAIESAFASIQPPDAHADSVRRALLAIVAQATDGLADLRIEVRRGHLDHLGDRTKALETTADRLDAFSKAHGS